MKALFSLLSAFCLFGCIESGGVEPTSELSSASSLFNLTRDVINTKDAAAQLLDAERREYRIVRFSEIESVDLIERSLNGWGKQGWDCAPINKTTAEHQLHFICKRYSTDFSGRITELVKSVGN